jgi:RHS repeat-associated protein
MVSVTGASGLTSYLYNALGQRTRKVTGNSVTHYLYDEAGHLLGEYDGSGTALQEIVWLGDTPVATIRTESCGLSIFYIHTDHLNTPRLITRRSTTEIVWRWDSDPFGTTPPNENPSGLGTFTFNLRLPGQYFDAESGLNYNNARDYDPSSGRYVESDPIGLSGGVNTYAYSAGDPLSAFDRSGLDCSAIGVSVTCSFPSGPTLSFPRPQGWPGSINPNMTNYHHYDIQVNAKCADPSSVMQGIINNPTPGTHNPASAGGTPNDATPSPLSAVADFIDWLSSFGNDPGGYNNNPVKSYVTSDQTGNTYEVNVTQPGHPLFPGYVARGISGGVVHNYGEGAGALQGPYSPVANAINSVWNNQTQGIINGSKQKCGCQQ